MKTKNCHLTACKNRMAMIFERNPMISEREGKSFIFTLFPKNTPIMTKKDVSPRHPKIDEIHQLSKESMKKATCILVERL